MSKIILAVFAIGLLGAVSGCKKPEPAPVYVAPEPITTEPTYTGKYK